MINVFVAYNHRDIEKLHTIINNLNSLNKYCKLQYYQPAIHDKFSTEDFLKLLTDVYLFVVLISDNSLRSKSVQSEISEAIRLSKLGNIKKICPIIIDDSIANSDSRIPECIKPNIYHAVSQIKAAQIIQEVVNSELNKV